MQVFCHSVRVLIVHRLVIVRANERNAALLAAYTPKPGKPFTEATDPVMMMDPPSSCRPSGAEVPWL
jgi:hypothetical protein